MFRILLRNNNKNKNNISRLYTSSSNNSNNSTGIREWIKPNLGTSYNTGINVKNSLYKNGNVPLLISNCLEKNQRPITWYTCGPTVYSSSHIGHARNYMSVDIIQRILINYFRLNIIHVMGLTDIDDKIINKSKKELISASELSKKFELEFIEDLKSLNIKPPMFTTRVSEHIEDIIKYIEKIKENQLTYESTKSVIFDVGKFGIDRYSSLRASNQSSKSDETLVEKDKKSEQDFVLWKAYNESLDIDGTGVPVCWESPFGKGRPGWHIECSAMINSIFANGHLDIHSGGVDLEFPHHQNEIAQCEGHSHHNDPTKQWANYFLHIGHLSLNNEKMSKSIGNVITIRDFLSNYTSNSLRWLCLIHKYNESLSYSDETLKLCIEKEIKFLNWFNFVRSKLNKESLNVNKIKKTFNESILLLNQLNETKYLIEKDLKEDFNTPSVIKRLELLMKHTNESINSIDTDLLFNIQDYIESILNIFGLDFSELNLNNSNGSSTSGNNEFLLETLLEFRSDVKNLTKEIPKKDKSFDPIKSKIYQLTDQLRDKCQSEISLRITDVPNDKTNKPYTIDWLNNNHLQLLNIKKQQQQQQNNNNNDNNNNDKN